MAEADFSELTLLLVDHDGHSAAETTALCAALGIWDVEDCGNPDEARMELMLGTRDLVIIDLATKQEEGITLITALRKSPLATVSPASIIALTRENDFETALAALTAGAHAIVSKPCTKEQMHYTISKVIRERAVYITLPGRQHPDPFLQSGERPYLPQPKLKVS